MIRRTRRQSSMSSPQRETQPISGTSPSYRREAVQCIISRSTSQEWVSVACASPEGGSSESGRSGNSVTGLVTLVPRIPASCRRVLELRKSPRAREGVSQLVFTSRLCQTFAIPMIALISLWPLSVVSWLELFDSSRIFNLPLETELEFHADYQYFFSLC